MGQGLASTGTCGAPRALATEGRGARHGPCSRSTRRMKWTDPSSFEPSLPTAPCLSTPGGPQATLIVLTGTQAGRLVPVDRNGVLVGRSDDADLVVRDPGVSGHHARIAPTGGHSFYVEDLRSANGTFVGPTRIGVSLLEQGDGLRLGPRLRLRFARTDDVDAHQPSGVSIRDS